MSITSLIMHLTSLLNLALRKWLPNSHYSSGKGIPQVPSWIYLPMVLVFGSINVNSSTSRIGSKDKPSYYKQVSLTSGTVKLLQTLIRTGLRVTWKWINWGKPEWFIKGKSYLTNLIILLMKYRSCQGNVVNVDFQKAFVKVPHNRFNTLHKNDSDSMNTNMAKLQATEGNGWSCDSSKVNNDVSQESVMGPLLLRSTLMS